MGILIQLLLKIGLPLLEAFAIHLEQNPQDAQAIATGLTQKIIVSLKPQAPVAVTQAETQAVTASQPGEG